MEKPKISVIVPVYNAEKFLHRCIDSILAQTFSDIEILLINDGSTDSSGKICDEYALIDARVRVFHKENGGVSSARNVGIKNMIGEYSIHVDSDDWIEPDMYEEMHAKAIEENADMVICDFFIESNQSKRISSQCPMALNSKVISENLLEGKIHGSLCNKLIRTKIIHDNEIYFKEDIIIKEDLLFNLEFLQKVRLIYYLSKAYYHYVTIKGSLTFSVDINKAIASLNYIQCLKEFMKETDISMSFFSYQVLYVKDYLFYSGFFTSKFIINYEFESNKYLNKLQLLSKYRKVTLKVMFMRLIVLSIFLKYFRKLYAKLMY